MFILFIVQLATYSAVGLHLYILYIYKNFVNSNTSMKNANTKLNPLWCRPCFENVFAILPKDVLIQL
jgi:hypothetical protein